VARILEATGTLDQMMVVAFHMAAKGALNAFGAYLVGRDRNAKFVKWEDDPTSSIARFKVPVPGTFRDVDVSGVIGFEKGEFTVFANVNGHALLVHNANRMAPQKVGQEMADLVAKELTKIR